MPDSDIPLLKIAPREGGYARGQEGYELILNTALFVLTTQGYKAMTLRAIAKECGMKAANISYYFKSKDDLVRELMRAIVYSYEYDANLALEKAGDDPEQKFVNAIRFVLTEGAAEQAVNLFPELWAMSNHDSFVKDRLAELYAREHEIFAGLVAELNRDISDEDRDVVAAFILSSLEGIGLFGGYGRIWQSSMPQLQTLACDNFLAMVKAFKPGDKIGSAAGARTQSA